MITKFENPKATEKKEEERMGEILRSIGGGILSGVGLVIIVVCLCKVGIQGVKKEKLPFSFLAIAIGFLLIIVGIILTVV